MNGYIGNIEKLSVENDSFRKVLYTGKHSQLVLMSLLPGEDIGEEIHKLDQFIRVEQGTCKAIMDGVEHELSDGGSVVIPAGMKHNLINSSGQPLKLYTIYSPPEHLDAIEVKTKQDALQNPEHFDGKTTE